MGKYAGSGVITCKPPKFVETGVYIVTISMDGVTFLPQSFELSIYKDANILKQFPAVIGQKDIKTSTIKLVIILLYCNSSYRNVANIFSIRLLAARFQTLEKLILETLRVAMVARNTM